MELPLAVQVAEACALQQWETVLGLCRGFTGEPHVAEWMALARAEALTQLSRRAEAEVSNLTAWQALRRQLSSSDSVVIEAPAPGDASSTTDLREWANIKRTDDWLGRENKNLSLLPDVLEPREGSGSVPASSSNWPEKAFASAITHASAGNRLDQPATQPPRFRSPSEPLTSTSMSRSRTPASVASISCAAAATAPSASRHLRPQHLGLANAAVGQRPKCPCRRNRLDR